MGKRGHSRNKNNITRKDGTGMGISGLQEQIARDVRRIDFLSEEKRRIGREISTLLDKDEAFRQYGAKFGGSLETEQAKVDKLSVSSNLPKLAAACGEDLRGLITGGSAVSAVSGIDGIKQAFADTVAEKEDELQAASREINRLEEEIVSCRREIAVLQEEERRLERGL